LEWRGVLAKPSRIDKNWYYFTDKYKLGTFAISLSPYGVKISDIQGKHVQTYEETITEEGLKNSTAKLFYKGTILYTISACPNQ